MTDIKAKIFRFCLIAAIASILLRFVSLLDMSLEGGGAIGIFARAVFFLAAVVYIVKNDPAFQLFTGRSCFLYTALCLVPAVLTVLRLACRLDSSPVAADVLLGILDVLLAVLWEELYFRGIGSLCFAGGKALSLRRALPLAAIFALSHAVNLIGGDITGVFMQMLTAFATGLLFLGLLRRANLFLPILGHLALNLSAEIFILFASEDSMKMPVLGNTAWILFAVQVIFSLAAGIILLRDKGAIKGVKK